MKTKSLVRLFVGLIFTLVVGTIYFVVQAFLIDRNTDHLYHMPESAELAVRVDGAAIVKNGLLEIILQSKDDEVLDLLEKQIIKKRQSKGPSAKLGIDYLSDILFYSFDFEGENVLGTTYQLRNPSLMAKNISKTLGTNQVYGLQNRTGVILNYQGDNLSLSQKKRLEQMAQKIAQTPARSELVSHIQNKDFYQIIKLRSTGKPFGNGTLFEKTNADVTLKKHAIIINGQLEANVDEWENFKQPDFHLNPEGFHFHSSLIPDELNDSLSSFFPDSIVGIPPINAISMNYFGGQINNTMKGLFVSPKMDLLVQFKDTFDLMSFMSQEWMRKKTGLVRNDNKFESEYISYQIEKLNDQTYYISSSGHSKVKSGWNNCYLSVSGDLTRLTAIKADPMIMTFISVMSIYSSSQSLFDRTKHFDICIENDGERKAKLQGNLQLKKGYYPMNEVLKFALKNRMIKWNQ